MSKSDKVMDLANVLKRHRDMCSPLVYSYNRESDTPRQYVNFSQTCCVCVLEFTSKL